MKAEEEWILCRDMSQGYSQPMPKFVKYLIKKRKHEEKHLNGSAKKLTT